MSFTRWDRSGPVATGTKIDYCFGLRGKPEAGQIARPEVRGVCRDQPPVFMVFRWHGRARIALDTAVGLRRRADSTKFAWCYLRVIFTTITHCSRWPNMARSRTGRRLSVDVSGEPLVWLNGQFVPEAEAGFSVFDSGVTGGRLVFETSRTFGGRPFRLEDHLDRLINSIQLPGDQLSPERGGPHIGDDGDY